MKKLIIASALSAAFVSPAVFAQASNFAGFYGQVGIGYEYNTVNSSGPNYFTNGTDVVPNYYSPNSSSSSNFSSSLGAGFGLAITDRILLSIGVEYQPTTSDTGVFNIDFGAGGATEGSIAGNYYGIKNRYGIFLSPGYAIDDTKLAYLKVGYTSQEVNVTTTLADGSRLLKSGQSVDGFLVGLGYKQLINKNIYFFAEANYRQYDGAEFRVRGRLPTSTFFVDNKQKSSNFNALVGIGARF